MASLAAKTLFTVFGYTVTAKTVVMLAGGIVLGSLLKPKAKSINRSDPGIRGKLKTGANIPVSILFGKYATAGKLEYANTWGKVDKTPNAYLTQVISLSDVPIQSLDKVFVNGADCTLGTTAHSEFGYPVIDYEVESENYMWVKFYDGSQSTADSYLTSKVSSTEFPWNATSIGKGVAYAIVTARVNRSLFTSFPQTVFECTGIALKDPTKSNRIGGDADHNPVLQIYSILKGIKYGGNLVYGADFTESKLDLVSWKAAIEICRVKVATNSGATEPRYRSGMEIRVDTPIADVVEQLLSACNGRINETAGLLKIQVGNYPASSKTINDEIIVSTDDITFKPFRSADKIINALSGAYPNPDGLWNMDTLPPLYNSVYEAKDGGQRYITNVEFIVVPYYEQCLRLMKSNLAEYRREFRHTLTLTPDFWTLESGDVITWDSKRWGYTAKLFRIDGVLDRADGLVTLEVSEIDPVDHAWDAKLDYRAPDPPPLSSLLIVKIPSQVIPTVDWDISPTSIYDGTDEIVPGIKVIWSTTDNDDVEQVNIEIRTRTSFSFR